MQTSACAKSRERTKKTKKKHASFHGSRKKIGYISKIIIIIKIINKLTEK